MAVWGSPQSSGTKYSPVQFDQGAAHDVCLSCVFESGEFCCQLVENAPKLDTLMKSLQSARLIGLSLDGAKGNDACLAVKDRFVYRGKIIEKKHGGAIVKFVDFGDESFVTAHEIFQIEAEFLQLPEQSIRCSLDGAEAKFYPPDKVYKLLNRFTSCRAFIAKVVCKTTLFYVLELSDEFGVKLIDSIDKVDKVSSAAAPLVLPAPNVFVGQSEKIYVVEILSNTSFFGQLCKYSTDEFESFHERIQHVYRQPHRPLQTVQTGDYCVAKYPDEDEYYRARVLNTDGSRCEVACIDSGKEFHAQASQLLPLAPELYRVKVYGIACSIQDKYRPLSDADMQNLNETEFTVVIDKQLASGYAVHVPDIPDNRVTTTRLAKYLKTPSVQTAAPPTVMERYKQLTVRPGSMLQCDVTHVDNPSCFYSQPVTSRSELDDLMDEIDTYCRRAPPLVVNQLRLQQAVLARYSDDQAWYRAEITGVLRAKKQLEVFFVDYGNTDIVADSELRESKPAFMNLEAQAIKCCLAGVSDERSSWPDNASNSFEELVTSASDVKIYFTDYSSMSGHYYVEVEAGGGRCLNESFLQRVNRLNRGYRFSRPMSRTEQPQYARPPASLPQSPPPAQLSPAAISLKTSITSTQLPSFSELYETHSASRHSYRTDSCSPATALRRQLERSPSQVTFTAQPVPLDKHVSLYVVHADSPASFWCQLKANEDALEAMMQNLESEYNRLGDSERSMLNALVNRVCCTKYSEDGRWYRAKVLSTAGGMVKVQFVDYGNTQDVQLWEVKELDAQYIVFPAQAIHCRLFDLQPASGSDWSAAATAKLEELTMDDDVTGLLVENRADCYAVELILKSGQSVEDTLINGRLARRETSAQPKPTAARSINVTSQAAYQTRVSSTAGYTSPPPQQQQQQPRGYGQSQPAHQQPMRSTPLQYKRSRLAKGDIEDLVVAFIVNPDEFYVHRSTSVDDLADLMESIKQVYGSRGDSSLVLQNPMPGMPCCALFADDHEWYRAQVLAVNRGQIQVRFVDYGNEAWVSAHDVKQLKTALSHLPAQAIRCRLDNIVPADPSGKWSAQCNHLFEQVTVDKTLTAKVKVVGDTNTIQLTYSNPDDTEVDISALLVGRRFAKYRDDTQQEVFRYKTLDLRLNFTYDVAISWVVDLTQFYCQLIEHEQSLAQMCEKLTKQFEEKRLKDGALRYPQSGDACICCYPSDGNWYRGVVRAVSGPEAKVQYIDYGNVETVMTSTLKEVSSDFRFQPCFAFKCRLNIDNPERKWTKNVSALFQQLTDEQLRCCIQRRDDDTFVVDLMDEQGRNVAQRVADGGAPSAAVRAPQAQYAPPHAQRSDVKLSASDDGQYRARNERSSSREYTQPAPSASRSDQWGANKASTNQYRDNNRRSEDRDGQRGGGGGFGDGQRQKYGGASRYNDNSSNQRSGFQQQQNKSADPWGSASSSATADQWASGAASAAPAAAADPWGAAATPASAPVTAAKPASAAPGRSAQSVTKSLPPPDFSMFKTESTSKAYVSSVLTPRRFFIQMVHMEDAIAELAEKLLNEYSALAAGDRAVTSVELGQLCCARYSDDDCWYRAKVEKVDGASAQVLFVDYGNVEQVPLADIRQLTAEYLAMPAQALECTLDGVRHYTEADTEKFNELADDGATMFRVKSMVDSLPLRCALTALDDDNAQSLATQLPCWSQQDQHPPQFSQFQPPEDACVCFVSNVESASCFSLQLQSQEEELNALTDKVTAAAATADVMTTVKPGTVCLAKFADDDQWYRAVVKTVAESSADVKFVDYGNVETIASTEIRTITDDLLSVAPLSADCMLYACEALKDALQSDAQVDAFQTLTLDKELRVTFKSRSGEPFAVSIVNDEDVDVNSKMKSMCDVTATSASPAVAAAETTSAMAAGTEAPSTSAAAAVSESASVATSSGQYPACVVPQSEVKVIVSHVESVGELYLQLQSSEEQLEQLMADVSTAAAQAACVTEARVGQACLAQFSEDKEWYRAVIVAEEDQQKVHVHFVDFGNSEEQDKGALKAISDQLVHVPKFCMKCRLDGLPAGVNGDQADAVEELTNATMVEDCLATFVTNQEPCSVKITAEQADVNAKTLPMLKLDSNIPGTPASTTDTAQVPTEQAITLSPLATEFVPSAAAEPTSADVPTPAENLPQYAAAAPLEGRQQVFVSHVVSPVELYVQLVSNEASRNEMEHELDQVYGEGSVSELRPQRVGMPCCAQWATDRVWYRSRVLAVEPINDDAAAGVRVIFVDHGNSDVVEASSVRELQPQFLTTPPGCYRCQLQDACHSDDGSFSQEVIDRLTELTEDKIITADVSGDCEPYTVRLSFDDTQINDVIKAMLPEPVVGKPAAAQQDLEEPVATQAAGESGLAVSASDVTGGEFTTGASLDVYVAHQETPSHLYVQRVADEDAIHELTENLQTAMTDTESTCALVDVSEGALCAALYTDDAWYRARVSRVVTDDGSDDAGKAEVFFIDYGNSHSVDASHVMQLPVALHSPPPFATRCSLHGVKPTDDVSGWSEAVNERFTELVTDETLSMRVVAVGAQLSDGCVVTLSSEDNGSIGNALLALDDVTAVDDVKGSDLEPKSDSVELSEEQATADVTHVTSDAAEQVRTSIPRAALTVGTKYTAEVLYVQSPSRFWVGVNRVVDGAAVEAMIESLREVCATQEAAALSRDLIKVGQHVAALSAEDSRWYRAEVMSVGDDVIHVHFVDYGNDEDVSLASVRPLTSEFLQHPRLAFECTCTDMIPPDHEGDTVTWSDEAADFFNDLIVEKTLLAEVKGVTDDAVYAVVLLDMGLSVAKQMIDAELAVAAGGDKSEVETELTEAEPSIEEKPEVETELAEADASVEDKPEVETALAEADASVEEKPEVEMSDAPEDDEAEKSATGSTADSTTGAAVNEAGDDVKTDELETDVSIVVTTAAEADGVAPRASTESSDESLVVVPSGGCSSNNDTGSDAELGTASSSGSDYVIVRDAGDVESEAKGDSTSGRDDDVDSMNLNELGSTEAKDDTPRVSSETATDVDDADVDAAPDEAGSPEKQSLDEIESEPKTPRNQSPNKPPSTAAFRSCDVRDGDTLEVYITHVVSPAEFYCQLAAAATELPLFEDKLVDEYRCHEQVLEQPLRVGDACVVFSDASWFRACVTQLPDDDRAHVFYVDYGTSGVVSRSQLREVKAEFLEWPVQVLRCALSDVEPVDGSAGDVTGSADNSGCSWDAASQARFGELCDDVSGRDNKLFKAHVRDVRRDDAGLPTLVRISLHEGDTCIADTLIENGYAQRTSATSTPRAAAPSAGGETQPTAAVAATDSVVDKLATNIAYDAISKGYYIYQGQASQVPRDLLTLTVGDLVTGTCDDIQSPGHFYIDRKEGGRVCCSLASVSPVDEQVWSEEAKAAFNACLEGVTVEAEVISVSTDEDTAPARHDVMLYDCQDESRVAINHLLIYQGHARDVDGDVTAQEQQQEETSFLDVSELRSDSLGSLDDSVRDTDADVDAYTHVTFHPDDRVAMVLVTWSAEALLCQAVASQNDLHELQRQLAEHYSTDDDVTSLPTVQCGQPCVVKSNDTWQRCVVTDVTEDSVDVRAVDEGSTMTARSDDVKLILPQFLRLPAQAVTVKLADCNSVCAGDSSLLQRVCSALNDTHADADGSVKLTVDVTESSSAAADRVITGRVRLSDGTDLKELLTKESSPVSID